MPPLIASSKISFAKSIFKKKDTVRYVCAQLHCGSAPAQKMRQCGIFLFSPEKSESRMTTSLLLQKLLFIDKKNLRKCSYRYEKLWT